VPVGGQHAHVRLSTSDALTEQLRLWRCPQPHQLGLPRYLRVGPHLVRRGHHPALLRVARPRAPQRLDPGQVPVGSCHDPLDRAELAGLHLSHVPRLVRHRLGPRHQASSARRASLTASHQLTSAEQLPSLAARRYPVPFRARLRLPGRRRSRGGASPSIASGAEPLQMFGMILGLQRVRKLSLPSGSSRAVHRILFNAVEVNVRLLVAVLALTFGRLSRHRWCSRF